MTIRIPCTTILQKEREKRHTIKSKNFSTIGTGFRLEVQKSVDSPKSSHYSVLYPQNPVFRLADIGKVSDKAAVYIIIGRSIHGL